ncbi:unnamed protein product [Darwinula stevensoni]|uniref:Uncharacterized protein n=1 Tax=Darwinula stevensoni TaxID=69355 RepID=A0A7R8XGG4_9CRUS|nr:unnamed protein product [Darwinula stevensoni]CAG0889701.1 unnamed protein product [Darwinula stevensoni]
MYFRRLEDDRVRFSLGKGVTCCDYSPSCNLIAGGCWDGGVLLWTPYSPETPFISLQSPGRLQDLAFIESTLFTLSRDARLCVWDTTNERLLRSTQLDFPARKVLGKHLEYPGRTVIPWGEERPPSLLLIGCCDYIAWISMDWVERNPDDQSQSSSSTTPKSLEQFDFDLDQHPSSNKTKLAPSRVRLSASENNLSRAQVPTASTAYRDKILTQMQRALEARPVRNVHPHTLQIFEAKRDGKGLRTSKWALPKIQTLRLAASTKASIHTAQCKQEASRDQVKAKVDQGYPYCALNVPDLTGDIHSSVSRSVSSQF